MDLSPPARFRTRRLVVRKVVMDDAGALFDAFGSSPEATRFLTWAPKTSVDEYAEFLEQVALPAWDGGSGFHWVIQRPDEPAFGMVSLDTGEHGLELGYVLAPEEWGKGLMAEAAAAPVGWALEQPEVYRVWATCDCDNLGSARVLEKLSFELEGTLRRWAIHPNISPEPRDSYCYSTVTDGHVPRGDITSSGAV